jgi:hypothetical protein
LTVHFIGHGGRACPEGALDEYLALAAKGRESVAKLAALFNEMAALDEAAALTPDQVRDLTALGVPIRERLLPPTPLLWRASAPISPRSARDPRRTWLRWQLPFG